LYTNGGAAVMLKTLTAAAVHPHLVAAKKTATRRL
jgi:hypothetical protein